MTTLICILLLAFPFVTIRFHMTVLQLFIIEFTFLLLLSVLQNLSNKKNQQSTEKQQSEECIPTIDSYITHSTPSIDPHPYTNKYSELLEKAVDHYNSLLTFDYSVVQKMTPYQFEDMVAQLFQKMGYKTHQTAYAHDGGVDIFAQKGSKRFLIECKHYKSEAKISRPAMQKLFAAINEHKADGGFFVATCQYSKEALEYGRHFNIETIDERQLMDLYSKYFQEQKNTSDKFTVCCRDCGTEVSFEYFDGKECEICNRCIKIVRNPLYKIKRGTVLCRECGSKMRERYHSRDEIEYVCTNDYNCNNSSYEFEMYISYKTNKNNITIV